MKQEKLSSQALLWTLICTFFASAPGWLIFSPTILVYCSLALAWRYLAETRQFKPLPWWLKLGLIILAVFILQQQFEHLYGRRAGAALLLMMLNLKATELYTRRDARVLLSLNLFLASVFFLFQQNLSIQIYSLLLLTLILYSLNLLLVDRPEKTRPWQRQPEKFKLNPDSGALLANLKIILYAIPLTIILFVIFPRLASPLWGTPELSLDGKTGLSDEMSPGSIQSLFMDDSPAFRVEFISNKPKQAELYWRGPVLWNFDGRRWSTLPREYRARSPKQLPAATSNTINYRVQLEPSERHWLYALDYVVVNPPGSYLTAGYQLFNKSPITNPINYRLSSEPQFSRPPKLSLTQRRWALALPKSFNPKSKAWIQTLQQSLPPGVSTDSTSGQKSIIKKVLDNFSTEVFYYSLQPPALGPQSVDDFMFNTRTGFCEHYASSFTVLMRMAGIPARVVTGYQGGYYNEDANYLLVRQSDAHAWSEVWLDDSGWVRIDPTSQVAPERILSGAQDTFSEPRNWHDFAWLRQARNKLDLIQHFWNNSVMGFTAKSQTNLLKLTGLDTWPSNLLALLLLSPIFLSIGIASYFLLKNKAGKHPDPVRQLYLAYLDALKKLGLNISSSDPVSTVLTTLITQLTSSNHELRQAAIEQSEYLALSFNQTLYSAQKTDLTDLHAGVKHAIELTTKVLH